MTVTCDPVADREVDHQVDRHRGPGLRESMATVWAGLAADDGAEAVISAAVLTSVAFRLRDEDGLVEALRGLSNAVARLEQARAVD